MVPPVVDALRVMDQADSKYLRRLSLVQIRGKGGNIPVGTSGQRPGLNSWPCPRWSGLQWPHSFRSLSRDDFFQTWSAPPQIPPLSPPLSPPDTPGFPPDFHPHLSPSTPEWGVILLPPLMMELTVVANWIGVIWKDWPKEIVASSTCPMFDFLCIMVAASPGKVDPRFSSAARTV